MKPSKTVPKGPRVVPLEEYQAHGLDHPTAAACLFFTPFLALQKQLTTPKPPEWRCSFVDRSGKTQDLGTHSGTRAEIAGKIRMTKSLPYWLEVELKDKTGEIFIEDFSTARGMSRHPVVLAEVKDDTQDPTSHHFRNFNWSPLHLAPKHAPLGLPKSAPPSIPSDCEDVSLAGIQSALVNRGLVLSEESAKAMAKATAKERRLFSRVECATIVDTITEKGEDGVFRAKEAAPYVVKTLDVFTESAHYRFPLTDKTPANQETPAAPASV